MKIEKKVAISLIEQKQTLALAESCTGGLLGHRLTNIPGSSAFLKGGVVAYSNAAKSSLLKIPADFIKKHGAVSNPVAVAMAQGARKCLKADFGIGITGIAGPDGGSLRKPVGTVFIAISTQLEDLCLHCKFDGSRLGIKTKAASRAFKLLLEFLL